MQYTLLALAGGLALPLQVGINSALAKQLNNPFLAAMLSFFVGTLVLAIVLLFLRKSWPSTEQLSSVPIWLWLGGLLGAFYVLTTIITAPQIGALLLVSLVVAGQMIASLVLDHYGIAGFPQHSINMSRLIGAGLVISGVILVMKN